LLAPRPTPKLEDRHVSAVRDRFLNIFIANLPYRRPFIYLHPEDTPCFDVRRPIIEEFCK